MIQTKINNALQYFRPMNRKVNELKQAENEGLRHRQLKEKTYNYLIKQNKSVLTEAIFLNGKRADIVVLNDFKVIEIVDSENKESINNKRKTYPKQFEIEVKHVGE